MCEKPTEALIERVREALYQLPSNGRRNHVDRDPALADLSRLAERLATAEARVKVLEKHLHNVLKTYPHPHEIESAREDITITTE